jgi:toxin HigB-1
VIKSFEDKETQKLFMGRRSKAVSEPAVRRARIKLEQLDQVESVEELKVPPGNRLHKLSGDREGQWAIRINEQYRICFRFENGDAYEVEVTDYH